MVQAIDGSKAQQGGLFEQGSADEVTNLVMKTAKDSSRFATGIGGAYDKAYREYLEALNPAGKKEISQAELTQKQLQYQNVVLVFQGCLQMASNTFQVMMSAIRQLSVR